MTETELTHLRAWAAAHATHGCTRSRAVLALIAEVTALRSFALSAADRILAQSELLSKRAVAKEPKAC